MARLDKCDSPGGNTASLPMQSCDLVDPLRCSFFGTETRSQYTDFPPQKGLLWLFYRLHLAPNPYREASPQSVIVMVIWHLGPMKTSADVPFRVRTRAFRWSGLGTPPALTPKGVIRRYFVWLFSTPQGGKHDAGAKSAQQQRMSWDTTT